MSSYAVSPACQTLHPLQMYDVHQALMLYPHTLAKVHASHDVPEGSADAVWTSCCSQPQRVPVCCDWVWVLRKKAVVMSVVCGLQCTCKGCAEDIMATGGLCPICRAKIESTITVKS